MESWPFKVIDDEGNPKVEVEYLGSTHKFSPQEISAMVLTKVSPLHTLAHFLARLRVVVVCPSCRLTWSRIFFSCR